jgi:hypothetical protein
MILPGFMELVQDEVIASHPTAIRVYVYLLRNPLICFKPQTIKTWLVAEQLKADKKSVRSALNLLIAQGYVMEHERGTYNERNVTVLIERNPPRFSRVSNSPPSSAA